MVIVRDICYYLNNFAFQAVILAVATGFVSYISGIKKYKDNCNKKDIIRHTVMLIISVAYAYMVVGITFLSRESGTIRVVNLNIFSTFYHNSTSAKYIIENIIMFLPYGVIYGAEYGQLKGFSIRFIAKRAVFTSIVIEYSQYIMARGRTEIDDILTNTIGAVIGWELVNVTIFIFNYAFKRKKSC